MSAVDSGTATSRVLLVIGSAARAGAEGQVVRLAARLKSRGHDTRVIFLKAGGPLEQELDAAGVPYLVAGFTGMRQPSRLAASLAAHNMLARAVREMAPTVVHAWQSLSIALALPVAQRHAPTAARIATLRGVEPQPPLMFRKPVSRLLARSLQKTSAVTVNSAQLEDVAIGLGALRQQIRVIPNGVTIPAQMASPGVQPARAVCVANMRAGKGVDLLPVALAEVPEPLTIDVFGDGELPSGAQLAAARLGVSARIAHRGSVADLAATLAGYQIGVHPSLAEGMSNAILEEMAVGLPVIATDVGATKWLIGDDGGTVVPAGDARALGAALAEAQADPSWRERAGRSARARASELSWDVCLDRYERLYREVSP